MFTAAAAIAYPDSYTPKTWHVYLVLLALLFVQGVITMQSTKFIGWVNKVGFFTFFTKSESADLFTGRDHSKYRNHFDFCYLVPSW